MGVSSNVYTVGTATVQVVGDSADAQDITFTNLEPEASANSLSRAGYLYLVFQKFTLAASGTAIFNIATPATGLQFEFYEIVSTAETVYAELIEGGTVTTTGTAIPAFNINRTEADDAATVFQPASAVTGGTAVSAELVSASKQGGGNEIAFSKIHTLRPSEDYAMRFTNQTNQETDVFVQIGFSEKFNGQNSVWLGNGVGTGARLSGGEKLQMRLLQGQTVWATAEEEAKLGVLRQD
jgi:hypothetical protein